MKRQHRQRVNSRSGITRVEVIMLLGMGLLAAIVLLPNLSSRRINSRKLNCLNSIRQVGLALQNFASQNSGGLPCLSQSLEVKRHSGQEGEMVASWAVLVLPALDAGSVYKKIKQNARIESGRAWISEEEQIFMPAFTCPDDPDFFKKTGRLSYVVNAGFISQSLYGGDPDRKHVAGSLAWTSEPDSAEAIAVHAATGVLWHQSKGFSPSLEYLSQGDGSSTTLMLTENLQAGNWYDTDTSRIGFGFPVATIKGQVRFGSGQVFASAQKPLNTEFQGGTLTTAMPQNWKVNADLNAKPGTLPRPSSNHAGGVNVIMCDGAGKFLNQNIDPHVYLKLPTSNGVSWGEGELKQSDW